MNNVRLGRNIGLSYLFTFISNMNFTHGIWMIYLFSKGISLVELGILEGIFHVTSVVMEIPTGAVADLWGRKASRIAGRAVFIVSLIFFYYGAGFLSLLPGFILMAMSFNLESGAGEALLYDSLKLLRREGEFMTINSRNEFLLQMGLIVAFMGGGYMAVHSYSLLFGVTAGVSMMGLLSACFFIEPQVAVADPEPPAEQVGRARGVVARIFGSTVRQIRDAYSILKKTPALLLLILSGELTFTFTTTLFFMLQVHWKGEGYSEWDMGVVYAVQCALSGIGGLITPRLERLLGFRWILILPTLLMLLCIWGVAVTPWSRVALVATGFMEGILVIAISDYTNRLIPSHSRATLLSFQSMAFSLFMIVIFPLAGAVGDHLSTKTAFIVIAGIASLWYLLFLPKLRILQGRFQGRDSAP